METWPSDSGALLAKDFPSPSQVPQLASRPDHSLGVLQGRPGDSSILTVKNGLCIAPLWYHTTWVPRGDLMHLLDTAQMN